MKEEIEKRLEELKAEFESGQKMLGDLESKQTNLRTTMLRISGAMQALEELLSQRQAAESGNADIEAMQPLVPPE